MFVVLIFIHHILITYSMQAESLTSFLPVPEDSDFPLENIPFGVVSLKNNPTDKFTATRIGIAHNI